ncbi:CPBP family intramembrane glutamic endopeptidase [Gorillibacterium massiliense]|uniref:CPBP family intramembrane glutamic endopeptidase n=1 Tax=Gorillibacterium massiliense TaxID=1280390 RepID=UPI0004B3C45A|nr:type II CAAX endopeptidase family protein [Gorillibacterium massiliense]
MKKLKIRKIRIRPATIEDLDERLLLINLLFTQVLTLIVAFIITLFQKNQLWTLFPVKSVPTILLWGFGFGIAVLIADLIISRFVPPDVADDGGINNMLFRNRPLWQIAALSLFVAFCEEMLFRGAIQQAIGAYWTSVLFAAIHVRYLQSWVMTGLVFSISYGFGWIYNYTGTLWTPVIAHFLIDFVMGCIIRYRKDE